MVMLVWWEGCQVVRGIHWWRAGKGSCMCATPLWGEVGSAVEEVRKMQVMMRVVVMMMMMMMMMMMRVVMMV